MSFVQSNKLLSEEELIKEVFYKINNIHNSEDYTEPLEMYIKRYKLNGYDIESEQDFRAGMLKSTSDFKRFTIIDPAI